jgi:hypothetical protein
MQQYCLINDAGRNGNGRDVRRIVTCAAATVYAASSASRLICLQCF